MAERGGYQRPTNPAPVSGPGALSRRTDGGPADKQPVRPLPNAKYGEGKDFAEIEGGAPMKAAAPSAGQQVIPLDAPSGRPDEPVTAGADAGAGPGMDALGIMDESSADLAWILPHMQTLELAVNNAQASPSTRAWLRRIKSQI